MMKTCYSWITTYSWAATPLLVALALLPSACDSDDPEPENVPETITKVTLTFTPDGGGTPVVATAEDPDDDGPKDLEVKDTIRLKSDTEYTLSIDLINGLVKEGEEGYSITEEVREEEPDEHQFFFAWQGNLFSDPTGDGNVGKDNRNDPVRYDDKDGDDRPIGLRTKWKTIAGLTGDASSTFRVMLKHQPDGIKTDSSTSEDGESDVDLTFNIGIVQ